jgi:hypothetical protein
VCISVFYVHHSFRLSSNLTTATALHRESSKAPSSWVAVNQSDRVFSSRPSNYKHGVPSASDQTLSSTPKGTSTKTKKNKAKTKDQLMPYASTPKAYVAIPAAVNQKSGGHGAGKQPAAISYSSKPSSTPRIVATLPGKKRKHAAITPETVVDISEAETPAQAPIKRKKAAHSRTSAKSAAASSFVATNSNTNDSGLISKTTPVKIRRGPKIPADELSSVIAHPLPARHSPAAPAVTSVASAKGTYSKSELQTLDATVAGFRDSHGLSHEDVAKLIAGHANEQNDNHHGANAKQLWDAISEALPSRHRQSLQKCARRKYKLTVRGEFTPEEDAQIIEAFEMYKTYKDKWVKVGEVINRAAPDVRDRYRNNLRRKDTQRHDVWDGEEEELFSRLIAGQLDTARKAHLAMVSKGKAKGAFNESGFYPNMEIIEEQMEGTRGNLQLRNKYAKLLKAAKEKKDAAASRDTSTKSVRVQTAEHHFERKMRAGDKYECLQAILGGMVKYKHKTEAKIPWSEIQRDNKGKSKWETPERKVVYERMKGIAGTNPNDSAINIVKEQIRYLERTYGQEELALRFSGDRRTGTAQKMKKDSTKVVSKKYVTASDEESQSDATENRATSDSSEDGVSVISLKPSNAGGDKKKIQKPNRRAFDQTHHRSSDEEPDSDTPLPSVEQQPSASSTHDSSSSDEATSLVTGLRTTTASSQHSDSSSSDSSRESESESESDIKPKAFTSTKRSKPAQKSHNDTSSSANSSDDDEDGDEQNIARNPVAASTPKSASHSNVARSSKAQSTPKAPLKPQNDTSSSDSSSDSDEDSDDSNTGLKSVAASSSKPGSRAKFSVSSKPHTVSKSSSRPQQVKTSGVNSTVSSTDSSTSSSTGSSTESSTESDDDSSDEDDDE